VLFAGAARRLGFGSRIISRYLRDADPAGFGTVGAGATNAWAEVYVPGAGWITFHLTNRNIGNASGPGCRQLRALA
jgi:transglutaminase-like putative cysteine protease